MYPENWVQSVFQPLWCEAHVKRDLWLYEQYKLFRALRYNPAARGAFITVRFWCGVIYSQLIHLLSTSAHAELRGGDVGFGFRGSQRSLRSVIHYMTPHHHHHHHHPLFIHKKDKWIRFKGTEARPTQLDRIWTQPGLKPDPWQTSTFKAAVEAYVSPLML